MPWGKEKQSKLSGLETPENGRGERGDEVDGRVRESNQQIRPGDGTSLISVFESMIYLGCGCPTGNTHTVSFTVYVMNI